MNEEYPVERRLCHCGCGQPVSTAYRKPHLGPRMYIHGHNGRYKDPIEAFWSKVDKSGDCWIWTGSCAKNGYGTYGYQRVNWSAHRLAWTLVNGPIPDGMDLCHTCDIKYPAGDISYRRCVRPDHMFIGTRLANVQDMIEKDRHARGERLPQSRLTDSQVIAIRTAYMDGEATVGELRRKYGVTHATILHIVRAESWRHLLT